MSAASLTERLASRLVRPVPDVARDRARLHLLDWLGCVAGGLRSDVTAVARAAEPDPLARAALLGNVLEMDDVHRAAILHPGPVVWPAALAAARETGASLGALLEAGVRGYEAVIAVGLALDARHYAHYHSTATAGGFGAASAAASLFGLAPAATADALGNWGSVAGGLWRMRHEPVMTKQFHAAHSALTGLWCARLARAGLSGPRAILEGEQGLFAATCAAPRPMPLDRTGWLIDEVSLKPWGACRHAHPTIDAALKLPPGALAGDGPIRVATYADALRFCDRPTPASVIEAKFSLQHAVAVVAVRGRPTLADFEPDAIADPTVAAVRARIQVEEDPTLTSRYPAHFGARVEAGGMAAEAPNAWGDPEWPLTPDEVMAKARALFAWGGADAHAEAAFDAALEASEETPASALLDLVTGLVGSGTVGSGSPVMQSAA